VGFLDLLKASENQALKEKMLQAERTISNLKKSYKDLEKSYKDLEKSHQSLTYNHSELQKTEKELKISLESKERNNADLEQEVKHFRIRYEQLMKILEASKNENNDLFLQNKQLITTLENYGASNFSPIPAAEVDLNTDHPVEIVSTQKSFEPVEAVKTVSELSDDPNYKTREYVILEYINGLFTTDFNKYLVESKKFRERYDKNTRCDICGNWDSGLYSCCGSTFCEKCLATHQIIGGKHRMPDQDYKTMAINHGAAISFHTKELLIKKWREMRNFEF
jgi:chromosome segregation ATPase